MHYFKHEIADFRMLMSGLSAAQRGMYVMLRDEYLLTEQALPADELKLFRICLAVTKSERRAVLDVVEKMFHKQDDERWHVSEWDSAIEAYRERAVTNSINGNRPKKKRMASISLSKSLPNDSAKDKPIKELKELKNGVCTAGTRVREVVGLWPNMGRGSTDESVEHVAAAVELGCSLDDIERGTREFVEFVEHTVEGGWKNRWVPHREKFFRERLWHPIAREQLMARFLPVPVAKPSGGRNGVEPERLKLSVDLMARDVPMPAEGGKGGMDKP